MTDKPMGEDEVHEILKRAASSIPRVAFDKDRGRALAGEHSHEPDDEAGITATIGWRQVAGDSPIEPRHTWASVPSPISDLLGRGIDSRISITPEGTPEEFVGASVVLDVYDEVPGSLVLVDALGLEYPMNPSAGSLIALIPADRLSLESSERNLPVYHVVLRFRWYPE